MKLDFKPTKWKIKYCKECKSMEKSYYCERNHQNSTDEIENAPFYLKEFKIDRVGYKGWAYLSDPSGMFKGGFYISPSHLERIILGRGIEPGGKLNESWWMFAKVGSRYSLRWVKVIDDSNGEK